MHGHLAFKFGKTLTPFKRKKIAHVNQVAYFMFEGGGGEIWRYLVSFLDNDLVPKHFLAK